MKVFFWCCQTDSLAVLHVTEVSKPSKFHRRLTVECFTHGFDI